MLDRLPPEKQCRPTMTRSQLPICSVLTTLSVPLNKCLFLATKNPTPRYLAVNSRLACLSTTSLPAVVLPLSALPSNHSSPGPFLCRQVDAPAQAAAAASAGDDGDAGDNDADAGYLSDSEIVQERRVKVASALDAEAAEKAREKNLQQSYPLSFPQISNVGLSQIFAELIYMA
jgi:hypothetical protein